MASIERLGLVKVRSEMASTDSERMVARAAMKAFLKAGVLTVSNVMPVCTGGWRREGCRAEGCEGR